MKFEDKLKKLEQIVGQLEKGEADLDESLKLFEDGIKLSRECQKMLDNAEKRVSVLVESDDCMIKTQFDEVSE